MGALESPCLEGEGRPSSKSSYTLCIEKAVLPTCTDHRVKGANTDGDTRVATYALHSRAELKPSRAAPGCHKPRCVVALLPMLHAFGDLRTHATGLLVSSLLRGHIESRSKSRATRHAQSSQRSDRRRSVSLKSYGSLFISSLAGSRSSEVSALRCYALNLTREERHRDRVDGSRQHTRRDGGLKRGCRRLTPSAGTCPGLRGW